MIISQSEGARQRSAPLSFDGTLRMSEDPRAEERLTKEEPAAVAVVPRRVAARRLLRAEVFYAVGLAVFAALALFAYFNAYFGWDLRVARAVQSVEAPWF